MLPLLLAARFGGYHLRNAGWAVLLLAAWACIQAARGRLSAPRSIAGVATFAMLGLVAWTTASIAWADVSRHDAWVEAVRATGYAAAFILGGALLANARSFARYAAWSGAGIALYGLGTVLRMRLGDDPLTVFAAGRLEWPIGYAPGLAGWYLFGAFLLLGWSCAADRRARTGARWGRDQWLSGIALAGAGTCVALAVLAQSRGTIPAVLVGGALALVAMPERLGFLLRVGAIAATLGVFHARLARPFSAQFDLRQAPFTDGADPTALLATAEAAVRGAATAVLVASLVLGGIGIALVPLGARLRAWSARDGATAARRSVLPAVLVAGALVLTVLVVTAGSDRSPARWVSDQWKGCVDPVEQVNDPGSGASYFANSGTGRCDYYRVALDNFVHAPLLGTGAGNFGPAYILKRETREQPRVAHSLPLQLLGELGLVGGLLGATVLGCVGIAASRFVRSGPGRDPMFAGAVGALAYWTAHASIDWLWQLPTISLPALVLGGGLVACVSPAQGRVRSAVAAPIATGVMFALVALVLPVTMADASLRRARDPEVRRDDLGAAIEAARDAQSYDPTWAEPAIVEASLLAQAKRRTDAANAARRAISLEPDDWSVQYRASGLIGLASSTEGLAAFRAARRLNPALPATVDDAPDGPDGGSPDALQTPDG